jgi:hypothetical protein
MGAALGATLSACSLLNLSRCGVRIHYECYALLEARSWQESCSQ